MRIDLAERPMVPIMVCCYYTSIPSRARIPSSERFKLLLQGLSAPLPRAGEVDGRSKGWQAGCNVTVTTEDETPRP